MATDSLQTTPTPVPAELFEGNRLDRPTFHRLYEQTPENFKAELIGGIVHVASPTRAYDGRLHSLLIAWLRGYRGARPDTDVLDNATVVFGDSSEPQPDACLRYNRGTSGIDEDGYCIGPPELVVEVSHSTVAHDLLDKRSNYECNGVGEYLVLVIPDSRAVWFGRDEHGFAEYSLIDGTLRSHVFPGLWLDAEALFRDDQSKVMAVLNEGLASGRTKK